MIRYDIGGLRKEERWDVCGVYTVRASVNGASLNQKQ